MRNGNLALARDYFAELTTFDARIATLQSLDPLLISLYRMRGKPNTAGAFSRNHPVYSSVAFQHYALDFIIYAIASDNIEYLHMGVAGIQYGFKKQGLNGSFAFGPHYRRKSDFGAQLRHAALFLSAAALSFQIINHSKHRHRILKSLVEFRLYLQRSMKWLARHDMKLFLYDQDSAYHLMNESLLFTVCGEIFQDPAMTKRGQIFLDITLELQRQDGAFLELNGHDSGYQASTIISLLYYLLFVQQGNDFNKILRAIALGIRWEKSRILPSGKVNAQDNTCQVQTHSTFSGRINDINYSEVVKAFLFYNHFTADTQSRTLAQRVFRFIVARSQQLHQPQAG